MLVARTLDSTNKQERERFESLLVVWWVDQSLCPVWVDKQYPCALQQKACSMTTKISPSRDSWLPQQRSWTTKANQNAGNSPEEVGSHFTAFKITLIMPPVMRRRYKGFNTFCSGEISMAVAIVSFWSFGYGIRPTGFAAGFPDPRMSRGIRSYLTYQIKACSLAPWPGRLAMKIGNGSSRK
jgi:hypothetical protein